MNNLEIRNELKSDIETNQNQLKNAIRNHQLCILKVKENPNNSSFLDEVAKAEELIIFVGLQQRKLLERLREDYKAYQKDNENNICKSRLEERRCSFSKSIERTRRHINATTPTPSSSSSDDSDEKLFSSPEHLKPVEPQDVPQSKFLSYFCLATHDVYKEMQNKRAERKRRSTANPNFLYGSKGWDYPSQPKRKRNQFLHQPPSPPHTRQASKRRQEKLYPQAKSKSPIKINSPEEKPVLDAFPAMPNLPSGLIIERISPGAAPSPDSKICITCKQPGVLSICETCSNGFHMSCHNRPVSQTPKHCPRCYVTEKRTVGSLNVPSGMTVSYVTSADVSERLMVKKTLEEENKSLNSELTDLENRHSELSAALRNQAIRKEELNRTQETTQEKIDNLLSFISSFKKDCSNAMSS